MLTAVLSGVETGEMTRLRLWVAAKQGDKLVVWNCGEQCIVPHSPQTQAATTLLPQTYLKRRRHQVSRGPLLAAGAAAKAPAVDLPSTELTDVVWHFRQARKGQGGLLPLLWLREALEIDTPAPERRENVVVVRFGRTKAGIVVDQLMGEHQTVIRPLGKLFSALRGVSGSTILGSGEIALILDVAGLMKMAGGTSMTAAGITEMQGQNPREMRAPG